MKFKWLTYLKTHQLKKNPSHQNMPAEFNRNISNKTNEFEKQQQQQGHFQLKWKEKDEKKQRGSEIETKNISPRMTKWLMISLCYQLTVNNTSTLNGNLLNSILFSTYICCQSKYLPIIFYIKRLKVHHFHSFFCMWSCLCLNAECDREREYLFGPLCQFIPIPMLFGVCLYVYIMHFVNGNNGFSTLLLSIFYFVLSLCVMSMCQATRALHLYFIRNSFYELCLRIFALKMCTQGLNISLTSHDILWTFSYIFVSFSLTHTQKRINIKHSHTNCVDSGIISSLFWCSMRCYSTSKGKTQISEFIMTILSVERKFRKQTS